MIRRTVGDTRVTYPVGPILKARFLHTKSKVCPKQGVPGETSPTALRKCVVWDWNRAWCGVTEREKSVQGVCDLVSPTVRTQATGSGERPGQSGQQRIYFSRKKYACFWTVCVRSAGLHVKRSDAGAQAWRLRIVLAGLFGGNFLV